jgi:hypothetical protein
MPPGSESGKARRADRQVTNTPLFSCARPLFVQNMVGGATPRESLGRASTNFLLTSVSGPYNLPGKI